MVRDHALEMMSKDMSKDLFGNTNLLYIQVCALVEGLGVLGADPIDDLPGLKQVLDVATKKNDVLLLMNHRVMSLSRAFLFRQLVAGHA